MFIPVLFQSVVSVLRVNGRLWETNKNIAWTPSTVPPSASLFIFYLPTSLLLSSFCLCLFVCLLLSFCSFSLKMQPRCQDFLVLHNINTHGCQKPAEINWKCVIHQWQRVSVLKENCLIRSILRQYFDIFWGGNMFIHFPGSELEDGSWCLEGD